ncbi:LysR family transcriptional regulator [Planctobacterium marinum]|uniref:LysR family transcriptional regulator n=1 Tax=Planctobacterium marinum TaxID=1631968 RepID=A0AA48KTI0_9ALTE|nr:LysR family transcriptional regulator [Planctobacterium marinum]
MHSIDYNLFHVLLTIYQQGSVSKAADKLHLTQPAVSHALARLREHFNDRLFERHGRQMIATEYCQGIIADVESSLHTLQNTLMANTQWQPGKRPRTFNIAVRDILEALYFPALVARLQQIAPQMRLRNHNVEPKYLASALNNGEIDLALDSLIAMPGNINNQKLGTNKFVLLCREGHAITRQCDLENYQKWPHVVAALKDSDINLVDNALTAANLKRDVVLRCENFYGAVQVVCNTDLIMTAPETAARQFATHLPLTILPLPLQLPQISIHLYWWQAAELDPAVMWLKNEITVLSEDLIKDAL